MDETTARKLLSNFHDDLLAWNRRLRPIADEGVDGAIWEEETDAPRNDAAQIQGLVEALLLDDLPEMLRRIEFVRR